MLDPARRSELIAKADKLYADLKTVEHLRDARETIDFSRQRLLQNDASLTITWKDTAANIILRSVDLAQQTSAFRDPAVSGRLDEFRTKLAGEVRDLVRLRFDEFLAELDKHHDSLLCFVCDKPYTEDKRALRGINIKGKKDD